MEEIHSSVIQCVVMKNLQTQESTSSSTGVSGGKKGPKRTFNHAWWTKDAYDLVAPILEEISAKADDGAPCDLHRTKRDRSLRKNGSQRNRIW